MSSEQRAVTGAFSLYGQDPLSLPVDAHDAPPAQLEHIVKDMQLIAHLLNLGQRLSSQIQDVGARLCEEIELALQGRAWLHLGQQRMGKKWALPPQTFLTLPVRFGSLVYGTLCVAADPANANQPAVSPHMSQLLAQVCAWLIYTLEQSTFIQGQCQNLDYQVHGTLTRREREVLSLMCRGYHQEEIAEQLCIAPATVGKHRQHIYEQLGVHNEHDAVLAAYHTGLFSLFEEDLF